MCGWLLRIRGWSCKGGYMSSTVGKCALCQQSRELRDSHFIPKGVYKRIRESQPVGMTGDPVVMTGGNSFKTSKQMVKSLLCDACELRLSTFGESVFLNYCLQANHSFPLLERLRLTCMERPESAGTVSYDSSFIAKPFPQEIAYFALSIFWRAAITDWGYRSTKTRLSVPPTFIEAVREFLLGIQSYPDSFVLQVQLLPKSNLPEDTRFQFFLPWKLKDTSTLASDISWYAFEILGMHFSLFVGPSSIAQLGHFCFSRAARHPIFVSAEMSAFSIQMMAKMIADSAPSTKLAKPHMDSQQ
jgi:hypothetical protein